MIFSFLKDPRKRGIAFLALVAILALTLVGPVVLNADARHLTGYRDGAKDASEAVEALGAGAGRVEAYLSTPHQLGEIREPARTVFVVLGNERRYAESETSAILDYIERGGNVILADEGGYGSDIAREVGFAFMGESLVDSRNHAGDPRLVVTSAQFNGREYRLLFNAPTALRPLSNVGEHEVLAESSIAAYPDGSYLDVNANGEIDLADAASTTGEGFALVVRTDHGLGNLVLVADTGVFMNGQLGVSGYENRAFITGLVGSLIPADGTVIVDEARHAPTPAVALFDNAVRTVGKLTSGPVAPLVTLLVIVLLAVGAWYATRETEDWSHHEHNLGVEVPVPDDVRPDLGRAQRMARRRISERFNIAIEQVAAMTAEELQRLTGDALLSAAAAGTLKGDPAPLFETFSSEARPS